MLLFRPTFWLREGVMMQSGGGTVELAIFLAAVDSSTSASDSISGRFRGENLVSANSGA